MTDGPLDDLAVLLGLPGRPADIVVPDGSWRTSAPLPQSAVVLWGRTALPAGTSVRTAASSALHRTRALATLPQRAGRGLTVRGIHRLDPPSLRTFRGEGLRRALLRGAVVELSGDPGAPRVLDLVRLETGAACVGPLRLGAGGTVLTEVSVPAGRAVLRVAPTGRPGDPARAADALRALADDPRVPPLLGSGTGHGASWTAEGRLAGSRPAGVTPGLAAVVASFAAGLPRSTLTATVRPDLDLIASRVPVHMDRVRCLSETTDDQLSGLPGVAHHGDLWAGNLLVEGDDLTGVVDWDAWSPSGTPGTDLLHLLATQERLGSRRSLGEVFLDRPWEDGGFVSAAGPYWRALGVRPTPPQLAAVGTAWWAGHVAGDLRRTPALADDVPWVRLNVLNVLAALEHPRWQTTGRGRR